ncbi:MAG TPA: SRPBCC domain-containing protein [Solirubrobacterales bacterium]|jgi:uncharacterized protein YndB with AHSA1/START domain|nr:SRPBCC domain-containing protein [Solirubrobacterales bacterium]
MQQPAPAESVEREVVVRASPEETWRALTDPDELREWLAEEAELDLRPGGELGVRIDGETREGFIEEVSEPAADEAGRLAFWWGEPGSELSRVEIELTEVDAGTRVRVIEAQPLVTVETIVIGEIGPDFGGAAPQMSALSIVG